MAGRADRRILILHIPITLIPTVHNIFGQLHSKTQHNVIHSTGVGLAMVHAIITLAHQVMDGLVEEIVVRIPVAYVIVANLV